MQDLSNYGDGDEFRLLSSSSSSDSEENENAIKQETKKPNNIRGDTIIDEESEESDNISKLKIPSHKV